MKKKLLCSFSSLFLFSFLFISCQQEIANEVNQEEYVRLTLSLSGDFLEITETPLLRSSESNNLYGIQVYSSVVDEDNYRPYGYGLFYGGEEIKVDLPNTLKYKIEATVVIDSKDKLYSKEVNGGIFYDLPFLTVADNVFYLDSENKLYGINKSEGKLVVSNQEGEVYSRPELDRYYGELCEIYPNDYVNRKVELEVKRVVSGLKFNIEGLRGTLHVALEEGPEFYISNEEEEEVLTVQKIVSLYGEEGIYTTEWFNNAIDNAAITLTWYDTDGSSSVLYDKGISLKRKVNYNFNIDFSKYGCVGDEQELVIVLEDADWADEEDIDVSGCIRFPEYDYLVIRYMWNPTIGRDLDSATEFSGTGVSAIEKKAVGYGIGNITITYSGETVLQWGGDNTASGYETVYVNMESINNPEKPLYQLTDRYIHLDLYATWFTANVAPAPINVEMTLYKGGVMQKVNTYDYENIGGEMVYQTTLEGINVFTTKGNQTYNRGGYTYIGTVTYDKFKNTADLVLSK